jgi:hypothetical protein
MKKDSMSLPSTIKGEGQVQFPAFPSEIRMNESNQITDKSLISDINICDPEDANQSMFSLKVMPTA